MTKPGAQHQGAADEDQRPVGQLLRGHLAAVESRRQRQPRTSPLVADQPGAVHAVGDQQQDRPPRPDDLADLDDHVDLDQRHHHEREEQHPGRPAPPARGPAPRAGHHDARGRARRSHLRSWRARSPRPHVVIDFSDSVATCAAHLGVAPLPLDELDRHLDHRQPRLERAVGHVGLEDVSGAPHLLDVDLLQRAPAEQPEARGGVVHRDPEQQPDVEVAAAGQRLAAARPVHDRTSGDPPRADHQVGGRAGRRAGAAAARAGGSRRRPSPRSRRNPRPGPPGTRPGTPPRGRPSRCGARRDVRVGGGELVGDPAGAVGRPVVDHEDVDVRLGRAQPARRSRRGCRPRCRSGPP